MKTRLNRIEIPVAIPIAGRRLLKDADICRVGKDERIPDDVLEQGRRTAQAMNLADFVALAQTTLADMR